MGNRVLWLAVLLLLNGTSFAADQVVTANGDNGGANQLRAKLAALQSSGGGTLTFNIGTATILLAQGPLPAITVTATIDGGGKITIDAGGASSILSVAAGASLTLKNLTLTNALNSAGDGGAVRNSGSLVVESCTFTNNKAGSGFKGGAIWSAGALTITDSEFGGNSADDGGAVYPTFQTAVTQITGCNFHDNKTLSTVNGWGGAILLWDTAPVTVLDSTFTSNSARFGGAFYVRAGAALDLGDSTVTGNSAVIGGGSLYVVADGAASLDNTQVLANSISGNLGTMSGSGGGGIYSAGTLAITNSTMSTNGAGVYNGGAIALGGGLLSTDTTVFDGNTGTNGGGIQVSAGSSVSMINCSVTNNTATTGNGGGINNSAASGGLTMIGSTVSGNSAGGHGGGIANGNGLNLTNSTISSNTAGVNGGGIFLSANSSLPSANLVNVTLAENSAPAAGGIYHSGGSSTGNITLLNTILAQNGAGNLVRGVASGGTIKSTGHNLSDDDSGDAFLIAAGDMSGPEFDAKLGPLSDNGGATQTRLTGLGSDAIDAGTATGAPSTDQRGVARPQGAAFDIGATEVASAEETSRLANISTRLDVETGDNVLIGGIIVNGTTPKNVLIRAMGPSLPLSGALADPVLELHDANTLLETNDNWIDSPNKQAIIDTTIPPTNDAESAIIRTLPANAAYTAIVRGANNSTGIGLVEVYDLDTSSDSRLVNISTRGLVQTGDNVMIGGFIVVGPTAETVLIRARGPSLPLSGTLADPTLEVHDENGEVITNDNWRDTQETEIMATGLAPANDAEAAVLITGNAGGYTAIVRGVGDTSGIALVEVYEIP